MFVLLSQKIVICNLKEHLDDGMDIRAFLCHDNFDNFHQFQH